MKKILFNLAITMLFVYTDTYAEQAETSGGQSQPLKISKESLLKDSTEEVGSNIPTFSELNEKLQKEDDFREKIKALLPKLSFKIKELKLEKAKLTEQINVLEKENSSLLELVQKYQNDNSNNDEKINLLNIKIIALEEEKADLLQKLFEHQMDVQKIKAVSFELNSLLNQMPPEDDITRECRDFVKTITDTNNRLGELVQEIEKSPTTYERGLKIKSLIEDISSNKKLIKMKLNFFREHEQNLINIHKKEIISVPERLQELKTQLETEKKKYKELANLKIEENLMNSINIIKAFRLSKDKDEAKKIKILEKALHEYICLKIKESELKQLETKIKSFTEDIDKIELISTEFINRYDKLEQMKKSALLSIEESESANDNSEKAETK